MSAAQLVAVMFMFLLPGTSDQPNPWKDKVPAARAQAEAGTPTAYAQALDVLWRADAWRDAKQIALKALAAHPEEPRLQPLIARALWRAGRIARAENVLDDVSADTSDRTALRTKIGAALSERDLEAAVRFAQRLEKVGARTAEDWYAIFSARFEAGRLDGLADILRKAETLTDPRNGYPETFVGEAIDGVPEFLEAVGSERLNQVRRHGAASLQPLVLMGLPSCNVMINGHGPYRMVLDTGGSIMIALDEGIAKEIGIKSVATASVRGVSGVQESGQALIDKLEIGSIECRRVLTRTFGVRAAIMGAADGILGTGIFSDARMTLDFGQGQVIVTPSCDKPASGHATPVRIVSDAKLIVPITLGGEPSAGLLDTGADVVAFSPERIAELFPDREFPKFATGASIGVGQGETPEVSIGFGVDVEFAGRRFENYSGVGLDVLDTVLSPIVGVQTDVLFGMPAFREMKTLTVDFPRCELWVEWLDRGGS